MSEQDKILNAKLVDRKEFGYELNGTKLNFVLRVDVKEELIAFRTMALRAIEDIGKEIDRLNEKSD